MIDPPHRQGLLRLQALQRLIPIDKGSSERWKLEVSSTVKPRYPTVRLRMAWQGKTLCGEACFARLVFWNDNNSQYHMHLWFSHVAICANCSSYAITAVAIWKDIGNVSLKQWVRCGRPQPHLCQHKQRRWQQFRLYNPVFDSCDNTLNFIIVGHVQYQRQNDSASLAISFNEIIEHLTFSGCSNDAISIFKARLTSDLPSPREFR